jgi:hypothetical protein
MTTEDQTYWDSLSYPHKFIISWWEKTHGAHQAAERNRAVQQFAAGWEQGNLSISQQHEFAFANFRVFSKQFAPSHHGL